MRTLLTCLLTVCLVALPMAAAEVPREAPGLTVPTPAGGKIDLSAYDGKVIALEFLLTTCSHCQQTSVAIQKVFEKHGAQGFQPVGVAINDGAANLVPGFVNSLNLTFPIGYTDIRSAMTYLQHSPVMQMMMPQLVIIDKKGQIRAQYAGTDAFLRNANVAQENLDKLIQQLLAE